MTETVQTLRERLFRFRERMNGNGHIDAEEQPLRAELFSLEQLDRHGRALAGWHQVDPRKGPDRLLPRLAQNEQILLRAYELVTAAVTNNRRIAPAAEWLLDNFYLIEEQIRTARRHLPRGYSRELPRLAGGSSAGYPRVYDIALELISHVDGRIDAENLTSFVASYQSITTLKLGELWAIPIMLRLALIENLRRVAARVAAGRVDRDLADQWAEQMLSVAEQAPTNLILVLADMARSNPPNSSAFVAEFARRLQGQNPALSLATSWIDQRLGEQGLTIEQLVISESQNQAADQVSIGNSISSLRFLAAMDWREFVESMSVVEHTLRGDPADVYADMDFATRDRYRHAVEEIAKHSRHATESDVAAQAVSLAMKGRIDPDDPRRGHIGYYLIDKGRRRLERAASMRLTPRVLARRIGRRFPLLWYLGTVAVITAAVTLWAIHRLGAAGTPTWGIACFVILLTLCASQLGVALANWLSTVLVTPRMLPRMDFSDEIPAQYRTIVVVPTMLTSINAIDDLLDHLEIRFLANRDPSLYFALLTDFRDSDQQVMPEDEHLVRQAREGIATLNEKYSPDAASRFFLFHRPRKWNEQEGAWMGYERKRGKLLEFNSVLRGGPKDAFSDIVGDTKILLAIKYVITLDTDTQLPRDSARQLVGTIAHPLNRPRFDARSGCVCEGYSILQPRVAVSLPSAGRSWFVRLFAGEPGVDPYTRAVSDVYQDVFDEGSFIGKGIYDVDAFEQVLSGRFPENAILSHDLIEGCHVRSAVVSDVQLYEEHPSRYTADVSRRHRWIRGDWQITPWLLSRVPGADARRIRNPLTALSKWKILDNIRRSLVPPAMTLLLILAWLALPEAGWITGLVFIIVAFPVLLPALLDLLHKQRELPLDVHLRSFAANLGLQAAQVAFTLVFLPYDAFISLDAIVRTNVRMLLTRRRLLEWQTASDAERNTRADLPGFYLSMWFAPALAAALTLVLVVWSPGRLAFAGPLLGVWILSPAIAWWLSRPIQARRPRLSPVQIGFLRRLSRRTWRYFEQFVSPEHNWLPPDNFQEHPIAVVAPRTSPTNIGMALLSNLSAYDFGYIGVGELIYRTNKTFDTLDQLERYRGHFFNWYDTQSLRPLPPLYVSTVDSGNLAGHLLTLRRGLMEVLESRILSPRMFDGIVDTVDVLLGVAGGPAHDNDGSQAAAPASRELISRIERLYIDLRSAPSTLGAALLLLQRSAVAAGEIVVALGGHPNAELAAWARLLERQCVLYRDELAHIAPWTTLSAPPESIWRHHAPEQQSRLHELRDVLRKLDEALSLGDIAAMPDHILPTVREILAVIHDEAADDSPERLWFTHLERAVENAGKHAVGRIEEINVLVQRCGELADMDFTFLYDKSRDLLSIGYNVTDRRLDPGYYDLLASEARLTSYIAIAQGQLHQDHWFALGRLLTSAHGATALLSWSGSMFEYLMPMLVMPTYENTLLDQTARAVIQRQIDYGRHRGVPWGISESGYNATDLQLNYQYRAFGVPGLGLKRGLAEDLVIAPYASIMALMVAPEKACRNLQVMADMGMIGAYGFYEAIDYTPSRLPRGQELVTVKSFMAHHEGMSLLSLAYLLLDRPMQRRFEADPLFKATDLLLQERIPKAAVPVFPHAAEVSSTRRTAAEAEGTMRVFTNPATPTPEVHLLSNGRYNVMVSAAGGGYSRWKDMAVTRWREDPTRDHWGQFCYLRDTDSNTFWSTAHQPTLKASKHYEAIFTQARAEFRRRDNEIDVHTEISVSPEDDIELRRVTISNRSKMPRTIELTSYGEVVLAPAANDVAHPAFSNLFVQTEILRQQHAILCTRRARSVDERPPWMMHLMAVHGATLGATSYETDRSKFIGRGNSTVIPAAMIESDALSDSEGSVLDPIVAIRRIVRLGPEETARIDIVTGMSETREGAMALVEKYHDRRLTDRVFEMAWTHSQVVLRHLGTTEADALAYGRLAGSVIYATAQRRSAASVLTKNKRGQSGLWGYGISGDLPIVLLRIGDPAKIDLVRQTVLAHAYWRVKGLAVDLVIWNDDSSGYRQVLQDQIMGLIAAGTEAHNVDRPGGIFVRRADQMSEEDRVLFQAVARVVLTEAGGTLVDHVERRPRPDPVLPLLTPTRPRRGETPVAVEVPQRDLTFFNGIGGFTRDGREYVSILQSGDATPAPWVNVIANPTFGTLVSESGPGYTWCENSHEFRLTTWHNDPVSDVAAEAFYIRDDENGRYWSPSPLPARGLMPYIARHGFGYSIFEYEENGIFSEMIVYVAIDAPVKFVKLKIRNNSGRSRRLSVAGYWEVLLGEHRHKTMMHVVTEVDPRSGTVVARNPYNMEFAGRMAFFDVSESTRTLTGDRAEFLGRNGTPERPAAMMRTRLSGRVGAGLDPCAALMAPIELTDGQERELVFMIGSARDQQDLQNLIQRFRGPTAARQALEGVWNYWNRTLGAVYVDTPDPGVNALVNGWLVYQVLSCRMWARTGFYQSGGAYGFRDQLQDSCALIYSEPKLIREHLLRCAAHQFRAGDVQHWWHPPVGRGVRTHFSDDYLWLPYVTCRYVKCIGDTGVLNEKVHFIDGRQVKEDEESYYDLPLRSDESGTLYDHCVRAIEHGLKFGTHGLPLIGCGDWNDGMNLVGEHGKGESVWLAFFLYDVLTQFSEIARVRGDTIFADKCIEQAETLRRNVEQHAWDGEWYRRAYFDNGEPLGSAGNPECQIDSLPQSWSVLSNAGESGRSRAAMQAVDQRLVKRDAKLIQLFTPPFDKSHLNPGYIKGYVPGVRENGGQYTHAAIWTIMAFAAAGNSEKAWELFNIVNPITHGDTPGKIKKYRVEPYVVAADVYGVEPHTGRGGWTWYTGSAGWMYRLIIESLLGLRLEIDKLRFVPRLPATWKSFKIHYRYRETFYHITISSPSGAHEVKRVVVDGDARADGCVLLMDDRKDHQVTVELG